MCVMHINLTAMPRSGQAARRFVDALWILCGCSVDGLWVHRECMAYVGRILVFDILVGLRRLHRFAQIWQEMQRRWVTEKGRRLLIKRCPGPLNGCFFHHGVWLEKCESASRTMITRGVLVQWYLNPDSGNRTANNRGV